MPIMEVMTEAWGEDPGKDGEEASGAITNEDPYDEHFIEPEASEAEPSVRFSHLQNLIPCLKPRLLQQARQSFLQPQLALLLRMTIYCNSCNVRWTCCGILVCIMISRPVLNYIEWSTSLIPGSSSMIDEQLAKLCLELHLWQCARGQHYSVRIVFKYIYLWCLYTYILMRRTSYRSHMRGHGSS